MNGEPADLLNEAIGQWQSYEIPLDAPSDENNGWRGTIHGSLDLAHINCLEIHSDTWDYGFKLWVDGVRFTFADTPAASIAEAKSVPESNRVAVTGIVTAAWPGVFYIEHPDRFAGIRVEKMGHGRSVGESVHLIGQAVNVEGERAIDASWIGWDTTTVEIAPLFVLDKNVGSSMGLSTTGLLVRACGRIIEREPSSTPSWFVIDDGSGAPVKCVLPEGETVGWDWDYVGVTGISSLRRIEASIFPILRIRTIDDVTVFTTILTN